MGSLEVIRLKRRHAVHISFLGDGLLSLLLIDHGALHLCLCQNCRRNVCREAPSSWSYQATTEPKLATGTVGTVLPGARSGIGTAGTVVQKQKRASEPSVSTVLRQRRNPPFNRGTAGTETGTAQIVPLCVRKLSLASNRFC